MAEADEAAEVERLRRELDEAKRRNEELEHELELEPHPRHRARKIGAIVLIVLAGILAPISTMGLWLRSQVTDTGKYVRTVAPLVSDPDVQDFVADRVTDRLFEEVDVQTAIQQALPERASFLSGALDVGPADGRPRGHAPRGAERPVRRAVDLGQSTGPRTDGRGAHRKVE